MDPDELERFARRFRNRASFQAKPPQKPKIGLPLITAARNYKEAFDAAEAARRQMAAEAQKRCPDRKTALAALSHLAESFGLPPFTEDDIDRAGGAG